MTNKLKNFPLHYYDLQDLGPHLDLAMEAHSLLRGSANMEVQGVKEEVEETDLAKINTITILNPQGAKRMGRQIGKYITIEIQNAIYAKDEIGATSKILAQKLRELLPQSKQPIMIVGLGNNSALPDSLGPKVIELTMATRHIFSHAPQALEKNLHSVCLLAPGVLGNTGIETAEIIRSTANYVRPSCIIAIDALAAANVERVGTSIQISDTGINPGSGIGNQRQPINQQTMGIPVIAIGVPTVVDSNVIIYESGQKLLQYWQKKGLRPMPPLNSEAVNYIKQEILQAFDGNFIVTPREIDQLIYTIAHIIAAALPQDIHEDVDENNYQLYLN
ncbi:MAG: GPR endopeptidase [Clostridiales bacterium]